MQKRNLYLIKMCIAAVLTAVGFLLDRVLTISTPAVKINLAFVPAVLGAILLGPIGGACVYGLTDLLGAILMPFGPYHPGFTVCAAVSGAVYGFFLYKKPKIRFLLNIAVPVIINCLIIGLVINTFWVSMLYGSKTYFGWFAYRLLEYAVLIPVQLITIPLLVNASDRIKKLFENTASAGKR